MAINLSVVIINYNNDAFIEQCVESVIKQSMKSMEILIIDDGSNDTSVEKIKNLSKKFEIIKPIFQSNKGPGAARNTGLIHASGKYIIFLDSDDLIEEGSLKKLIPLMEKYNADTLIANIKCFNEHKEWFMSFSKKLFNKNGKILKHIKEDPELHLTPSASNKIYRRDLLLKKEIRFDTQLKVGEDLLFTQKALNFSNYTVVKNIVLLNYRVREGTLSKEASTKYFNGLAELQYKISQFYKEYKLNSNLIHIERRQLKFFADSIFNKINKIDNYFKLIPICKKLLESIENIHIINEMDERYYHFYKACLHKQEIVLKSYLEFLYQQKDQEPYLVLDDKIYSSFYRYCPDFGDDFRIRSLNLKHRIEVLQLRNNKLTIGGYAYIENLDSNQVSKELVFKSGKLEKTYPLKNTLRTDISYVFSNNKINYNFSGFETIEIDLLSFLGHGSFDVYIRLKQKGIIIEEKVEIFLAQLRNNTKCKISLFENKIVEVKYNESKYLSIKINKTTFKSRIKLMFSQFLKNSRFDFSFLKNRDYHTFLAILIYRLFNKLYKERDIWLIGERKDTAQDNSYYLFKYIRENYPKTNAYYVIDKGSNDYHLVLKYGKVIKFGSLKHTLYLLFAKKTINSYLESSNMYTEAFKKIIKFYPEWQKSEKIFLQHGVIGISRVNHSLHKNRVNYSKFVVSSTEEKKHIVEEFGYSDEEVIVTGLARWDGLEDRSNNKNILLMPTWRKWIDSEQKLLQSNYYHVLVELLADHRLHFLLEKYDFQLKFYPHFHIQKYIKNFPDLHERIKFIRFGEETVQNLLKDNWLLITDYSSVAEDFKMMNKPVIYYQFDGEEFFSNHYNRGVKKYSNTSLEYICKYHKELIENIENVIIKASKIKKDNKVKKTYCSEIYKQLIKEVDDNEYSSYS